MHTLSARVTRQQLFSTIMRRANDTLASLLTGTEVLSSAGLGVAATSVSTGSFLPPYPHFVRFSLVSRAVFVPTGYHVH
jgi:hypothetical protein